MKRKAARLFVGLAVLCAQLPAATKRDGAARRDMGCGALVATNNVSVHDAVDNADIAVIVEAAWSAVHRANSALLHTTRHQVFPIVARVLIARAVRENLRGPALHAAAAEEVQRIRDEIFPSRKVGWVRTIVSVLFLFLNRIGINVPSLNRAATENLADLAKQQLPGWAREQVYHTLFLPSSGEASGYRDMIRNINAVLEGDQPDAEKVTELGRLFGTFLSLTQVGFDWPRLIEQAVTGAPYISRISPKVVEQVVPFVQSLMFTLGKSGISPADNEGEATIPLSATELYVRAYLWRAMEQFVAESVFGGWVAAELTAASPRVAPFIRAHASALGDLVPAFIQAPRRFLYLPDLVITTRDILALSGVTDKEKALRTLANHSRIVSRSGDPVRAYRNTLGLEPLELGDYEAHFTKGAEWYAADPQMRVLSDVLLRAVRKSRTRQEFQAFRLALEKAVFHDDPPSLIASVRLLQVRALLDQHNALPAMEQLALGPHE